MAKRRSLCWSIRAGLKYNRNTWVSHRFSRFRFIPFVRDDETESATWLMRMATLIAELGETENTTDRLEWSWYQSLSSIICSRANIVGGTETFTWAIGSRESPKVGAYLPTAQEPAFVGEKRTKVNLGELTVASNGSLTVITAFETQDVELKTVAELTLIRMDAFSKVNTLQVPNWLLCYDVSCEYHLWHHRAT